MGFVTILISYFCILKVSVLKSEKDLLSNAEKRAQDEIQKLSERLFRVQVSF